MTMQRAALIAALILPFGLLYARAGAELAMGAVDILFLVHAARTGLIPGLLALLGPLLPEAVRTLHP